MLFKAVFRKVGRHLRSAVLKEQIKKIMSLENQEKGLKLYFYNYATSLELETIMLK
jgi:hypothetical protein